MEEVLRKITDSQRNGAYQGSFCELVSQCFVNPVFHRVLLDLLSCAGIGICIQALLVLCETILIILIAGVDFPAPN